MTQATLDEIVAHAIATLQQVTLMQADLEALVAEVKRLEQALSLCRPIPPPKEE